MNDQQFRQLLEKFGRSWSGYRKVRKGVKKRIRRHMRALGCSSLDGYLAQLDKNSTARRTCERLLSVSISRFFRDRRLWEVMAREILPQRIQSCGQQMRVWVAGCACGEEVYSFRIVWDRLRASAEHLPDLQITATDLNPVCLERANAAAFPLSSLKEVPAELRSAYFTPTAEQQILAVIPVLKTGIRWRMHSLLSEPPGSAFDMIFMRNNLLTYYRKDIQTAALRKVLGALSAGGCLIIGSHEKLPSQELDLQPVPSLACVFTKAQGISK
jgi:chemotaxis methyl-accepting protein methylase